MKTALLPLFTLLGLSACPSGGEPLPTATCSPPTINHGPCPQEIRDWTRIQGPGPGGPQQVISTAGAGVEHVVIPPGTCVYTAACGKGYRVQGCYLADGYMCP